MKEKKIKDVLPARDHYWLLHDGEKYARHGTEEKNGVRYCLASGR